MQQQSLNRWRGHDQAFLAKRLAASFRRLAKMDEVLAPYLAGAAPPLRFYVINQVDAGQSFSEDMAGVFKLRLGDAVLGTVQRDVSFREAQAYGRDTFDPALNSGGCQDVTALCRAVSFRIHSPRNSH